MKRILIILFIVGFGSVHAQLDSILEDSLFIFNKRLKFTPAELALFVGFIKPAPAIEFAYERGVSNHFSVQVVGNFLLPMKMSFLDNDIKSLGGGKVGLEFRAYKGKPFAPRMIKGKATKHWYIAIEAYQEFAQYFRDKEFKILDPGPDFSQWTEENLHYKRWATTLNCKLGVTVVKRKFNLDLYAGLGIRYRSVTILNMPYFEYEFPRSRHPNFDDAFQYVGTFWVPNLAANIRLGIPF